MKGLWHRHACLCVLVVLCAVSLLIHHGDSHGVALAYVGPGAGFAFLGSFLSLVAGFVLSFFSLALWPFRMAWRLARRRQGFRNARVKKVIFLGMDGLDPKLTERYLAEGKLPNLARLKEQGSYSRLRTTFPALSPVAWSTFATGVNPARHNIFDFLNRNMKSYVPELAAAKVHKPSRVLKLGKLRIPLSQPHIELRRKSLPFWKLLGERQIGSTIIRVPITFPPDNFNGRLLSAMSTPDLRGTQGSFSQFTTRVEEATFESGSRYPLKRTGGGFEGSLEGPEDVLVENGGPMRVPFRIGWRGKTPVLEIQGGTYALEPGAYTPWIKLKFKSGLGVKVNGIARFLVTETGPHFSLYCSPVQIDPEKPALPISHPSYYAAYLAKLLGTYSTLGMAEDTWALNEGVISEDEFLKQAYLLMDEREAMFRNALDKTRRGVVACVFDTSDRVQHMFYRSLGETRVIEDLYQRMDRLAGLALEHVDRKTVLFVLSDHGFCSFRRGIDLNAWLRDNGYLALHEGAVESGRYFKGVDWSRTRAYTLGLGGLYLNLKGREAQGIVTPGAEAEALKRELIEKLAGLRDKERDDIGIRAVYAASALYRGPYLAEAPDLIVGYNEGYRTSWDAAVGKVTAGVFTDNEKAWSGDHSVDPLLVPGVLFSNRKIEAQDPGIEDMAPTVLDLFGVERPSWMEGRPVFSGTGILACVGLFCLLASSVLLPSCTRTHAETTQPRVIVLGIDGMDPTFVEHHWDALPNLDKLRRDGEFKRLETTMPPQSPVAWSTFITGMNPDTHGIFDFVHRNPRTLAPYSSMSQTAEGGRTISVGQYELPLSEGHVASFRKGTPFWQILSEHRVPVTVMRMPTDFPPVHCEEGFSMAGMGTPDLRGTFGTFAFYTDDPSQETRDVPGGRIIHVSLARHAATLPIQGPDDSLRKDKAPTYVELAVHVDPEQPAARFDIGDNRLVLRQGEWSGWIQAQFPLIPHIKSAAGMFRIYAKQLHPRFELYVSPINIDPSDPALPISAPESWSRQVEKEVGLFYTQGMPYDTAAFRQGVFDREEYVAQSRQVSREHLKLLRYAVDHFHGGMMFFHFFGIDQDSHMLWGKYDDDLLNTYRMVDQAVGWVRKEAGDDTTLIVMSDHGFTRFDRAVHLNNWLMREGFLALDDPKSAGNDELFAHVDWSRTKAYSVGLNGIYLNLQGREREGIVAPGAEAAAVLQQIAAKLRGARDPENGKLMVGDVEATHSAFHDVAPDLIVGYMPGYRSSWQTALGAVPAVMVEDNTEAWRGDHCIDARFVPGVLISNRKFNGDDPHLYDLTVSVMALFGVGPGPGMIGHSIY